MEISRDTIDEFHAFADDHIDELTALVNFARRSLGETFDEDVPDATPEQVRAELDAALADDDLALNVAALYKVGLGLDVRNDYAGFVVDEMIGRRLANCIAGDDPRQTLAEATFHYVDVHTAEVIDEAAEGAGFDDVLAGIAAGVQCRLPGWDWHDDGIPE
jgi:hypothetical protein